MKDRPLIVRRVENGDVSLLGSVHSLRRNVQLILREIDRLAPGFVALELTDAERLTGALDIDAVNRSFHDRIVCLDRKPDITSSRYLCDTPPLQYLKESLYRYVMLPFNMASILAFNYVNGLYRALWDDHFFSFGWSDEDARRYVFERDEYMAAKLIGHMRAREEQGYRGRYAVVVGRRHVYGMEAILEAYHATGDTGSYYAGGKVIDVFSLSELEEPYTVSENEAGHNLMRNRIIESLARTIYLPAFVLGLFLVVVAIIMLIAMATITITGR